MNHQLLLLLHVSGHRIGECKEAKTKKLTAYPRCFHSRQTGQNIILPPEKPGEEDYDDESNTESQAGEKGFAYLNASGGTGL
jgi:hypothetical protein